MKNPRFHCYGSGHYRITEVIAFGARATPEQCSGWCLQSAFRSWPRLQRGPRLLRSQRNQQMEISQVSAFHWCWVSKPGLGCSARYMLNCFDEQKGFILHFLLPNTICMFGSAENCCQEVRYKTGGKRAWCLHCWFCSQVWDESTLTAWSYLTC